MFALADEVAVEPDLLERWRSGRARHQAQPPAPGERHLRLVRDAPDAPRPEAAVDPSLAEISGLLAAPGGAAPPTFPAVEPRSQPVPRGELWGEVLVDALARLHVHWD